MKACVLDSYKTINWRNVKTPIISSDEILVKSNFASICGSDQHIFSGDFHPRTRLPLIPGHEFVGTIVEIGKNASTFKMGDRVAVDPIIWCGKCPACQRGHYPACTSLKLIGVDLDGGFGEYVAVKPHMLYKLTENISTLHGALVEVLGIGFHASNRANVQKDDSIVIWGAGKVGQCLLQAVKTRTSGKVILVDILNDRLERARNAFPDIEVINPLANDPIEAIRDLTNGTGVDVAFEVVGHDTSGGKTVNPVRGCIQSIRGAGTVCVLGLGDEPAPVVFKELIWKEARIVASRVSHGEFAEVIDQMDRGNLKPEALITDIIPASQVQEGFHLLETEPEKHLKIVLEF